MNNRRQSLPQRPRRSDVITQDATAWNKTVACSDEDAIGGFGRHEEVDVARYEPRRTTCLACGTLFESFDPRYNRRCRSCQTRLEKTYLFGLNEAFTSW